MSCDCPHPQDVLTGGRLVLSKNDMYKIRTGRILEYHFHGSQFHNGRLSIFVANEKSQIQKNSKMAKIALSEGEVTPVTILKNEMEILQEGKQVLMRKIPTTPEFNLVICTDEQWNRYLKENKS